MDTSTVGESTDALADRLTAAAVGTAEILAIHLGDRLGFYDVLVDRGDVTAAELAELARCDRRYVGEWLEAQAVGGYLEVSSPEPERRYRLTTAAREVLTDRSSLAYLTPLARLLAAAAGQLPALVEAYRDGTGVPWSQFGPDARTGQADMNRPWFEHRLPEALASLPDLHGTLGRDGARLADVGCGEGWSTVALARAYPTCRVDGYDADAPSVAAARAHADGAEVGARVQVHLGDAATALPEAVHDVVFAFECLHDLPHPVEVLTAIRRSLRPGGCAVVMDEAAAAAFDPPGDLVERLLYGFSTLICLPDAMAHRPTAATGTVMREATVRDYARRAGFARTEVLPISDFGFWRFYRLVP